MDNIQRYVGAPSFLGEGYSDLCFWVGGEDRYGTETNGFSCAIRARMYFNVIWRSRVKPEGNKDEESLVKPDKQVDLY